MSRARDENWVEVIDQDSKRLLGWLTTHDGREVKECVPVRIEQTTLAVVAPGDDEFAVTDDEAVYEERSLYTATLHYIEDASDRINDPLRIYEFISSYAEQSRRCVDDTYCWRWKAVKVSTEEHDWLFDLDVFVPIDTGEPDFELKADLFTEIKEYETDRIYRSAMKKAETERDKKIADAMTKTFDRILLEDDIASSTVKPPEKAITATELRKMMKEMMMKEMARKPFSGDLIKPEKSDDHRIDAIRYLGGETFLPRKSFIKPVSES